MLFNWLCHPAKDCDLGGGGEAPTNRMEILILALALKLMVLLGCADFTFTAANVVTSLPGLFLACCFATHSSSVVRQEMLMRFAEKLGELHFSNIPPLPKQFDVFMIATFLAWHFPSAVSLPTPGQSQGMPAWRCCALSVQKEATLRIC